MLARAAAIAPADWHGPFAAAPHALGLDLFTPRRHPPGLGAQPLGGTAAAGPGGAARPRRRPSWAGGGAAGRLGRAQPAFRGPNWACGQEAALRALHLGLALALLGADHAPPPGARALLALHGRRIAATPAYALAQDNNHTVSEAAGLLACGLLLGEAGWTARGAARLEAALHRLVAPDGSFAQLSTGYHRLLLDVLATVEWLRRRLGGPPLLATDRAAAPRSRWLHRLAEPATGALPRLGHQDGSAFADLALAGPDDARPSLERAARLFCGASAGLAAEPGCAWLDLPAGPAFGCAARRLGRPEGLRGWHVAGGPGLPPHRPAALPPRPGRPAAPGPLGRAACRAAGWRHRRLQPGAGARLVACASQRHGGAQHHRLR